MSAKITTMPEKAKPDEPAEERKIPMLSPHDFKPAEFGSTRYLAYAKEASLPGDFDDPTAFAHMAHILRPCDEVVVIGFNLEFLVRVFIVDVENGSIVRPVVESVRRLPARATPSGPVLPEGFEMKRTPKGYQVTRMADRADFGMHDSPTTAILHVRNHASQRPPQP